MALSLAPGAPAVADCGRCGQGDESHSHASKKIVETAANDEFFSTLVKAVKAAGLAETLQGEGPFTVFAPNNSAFDKLPDSTFQALLKPGNGSMLRDILKFHVVPDKVMAKNVMQLEGVKSKQAASVKTAAGSQASVKIHEGNVIVAGSKVTKTDIEASNGVIYVVDSVMLPGQNDMVETAASKTSCSTLTKAIKAVGLVETLQGDGPYTLFAPVVSAFGQLPEDKLTSLLKAGNKQKRQLILTCHVVAGSMMAEEVMGLDGVKSYDGTSLKTVEGSSLSLKVRAGSVMVDGAKFLIAGIHPHNGVIHVIDRVLMPAKTDPYRIRSPGPSTRGLVGGLFIH
jgi:uncharacterized surface protein with fasciclin (FAS1) repeats